MITKAKCPFTPADVDYDESRLEELDAHFQRLMKKGWIQSANYTLSRNGKVFANTAIGKQSFEESDNRELKPDVIRGIASITKIFTATALFKLFEDGYIRPNQPVCEIMPEFEKAPFNGITIAHLLTHTSGLYPDGGCFPYYYTEPWSFVDETKEGENWVENSLKSGMYNKPGKEWAYCSFGFVLLGEIISRVSTMRAEAFIRKVILDPCGMSSSFFKYEFINGFIPDDTARNWAERLYIQDEDDKKSISRLADYHFGKPVGNKEFNVWDSVPATGGGLFSCTEDLNRFGRMLINNGYADDGKRVIGRKAIDRMTENYTTPDILDNCWGAGGVYRMYALGPDTRRTADSHFSKGSFFHEGAGACSLLMDPQEKMVASWFVPWADGGWHAEALYNASAVMWSGLK